MIFNVKNEDKDKVGVYCITNLINNKIYIGSTGTSFIKRFTQHKCDYNAGHHNSKVLCRAYSKYGIHNFEFKIICICNKKDVIKMEQFYINKGSDYNCAMIAGSLLGTKRTDECRKKMKQDRIDRGISIKIDKYDLNNNLLKTYDSITDASKDVKGCKMDIIKCLRGKNFSVKGFRFAYHGKELFKREKREQKYRVKVSLQKDDFYREFKSCADAAKYLIEFYPKCTTRRIHSRLKTKRIYKYNLNKIE